MGKEQRRSARIPVNLPVRWIRRSGDLTLTAADVNLGGLFLRTDSKPIENALMHLEVALPEGAIRFFAVSRYVGTTQAGHGVGVQIHLMDETARNNWNHFYRQAVARHRAQQQRVAVGAR